MTYTYNPSASPGQYTPYLRGTIILSTILSCILASPQTLALTLSQEPTHPHTLKKKNKQTKKTQKIKKDELGLEG